MVLDDPGRGEPTPPLPCLSCAVRVPQKWEQLAKMTPYSCRNCVLSKENWKGLCLMKAKLCVNFLVGVNWWQNGSGRFSIAETRQSIVAWEADEPLIKHSPSLNPLFILWTQSLSFSLRPLVPLRRALRPFYDGVGRILEQLRRASSIAEMSQSTNEQCP